jgi:hypothetical protein
MCNFDFDTNLNEWEKTLNIPIFSPIEFFYPYNQEDNIFHLKKYFIHYEIFIEQYNYLNLEMKKLITNLS